MRRLLRCTTCRTRWPAACARRSNPPRRSARQRRAFRNWCRVSRSAVVPSTSMSIRPSISATRFRTAWPTWQRVEPLLETALGKLKGGVYTRIIDARGYSAIHNQKYSRPLTGNYENDLVGNRTRRIWDDVTGQRGAKNTLPLLVQTYARDTGEILSEINMPITIGGRHWGSIRVGCESTVLLEA